MRVKGAGGAPFFLLPIQIVLYLKKVENGVQYIEAYFADFSLLSSQGGIFMSACAPTISIIMPAYNAEAYIRQAIRSVQEQTFKDWELILIEDCSTDNTLYLIQDAMAADSRLRLIQNPCNLGVSRSRNAGIDQAKGKWIAFLDSDDCWAPEKLEKQLAFAKANHCPFTFTGSGFMDENGNRLSYYLPAPKRLAFRQLLKQNLISCSSVLIRRDLLSHFPADSERIHEDFALWLQILKERTPAAMGLDEPLLIYRLSAASKSGNKLKAACMTFRVYRYVGLSLPAAIYYWGWYTVRSLRKYGKLKGR